MKSKERRPAAMRAANRRSGKGPILALVDSGRVDSRNLRIAQGSIIDANFVQQTRVEIARTYIGSDRHAVRIRRQGALRGERVGRECDGYAVHVSFKSVLRRVREGNVLPLAEREYVIQHSVGPTARELRISVGTVQLHI